MIATAAPGALVGGPEERFHLRMSQESDQPPGLAFIRNSKDLLNARYLGGFLVRSKPEKGTDGSQTQIASARTILTALFTVIQKGTDDRGIDILPSELRRLSSPLLLHELEQELEGVAIAGNRVGTDLLLVDEIGR